MSPSSTVLGALLAGGAGSRFAGSTHKLLAPLGTGTVWEHSLRNLRASAIECIVVVTGAEHLPIQSDERMHVVHNEHWEQGQSTSLRAAIDFAEQVKATALVVGLADQPGISPEAWNRVAAATCDLATADYDGTFAHPVRLSRSYWNDIPRTGDLGARTVLSTYAHLVERIPCPGSPLDIDTTEDLEQWLKQSPTNSP